jgi:hypothetical protein
MASLKGKHSIVEIEGARCTLVESGLTSDRKEFLKSLLTFNKQEVLTMQEKAKDGSLLETWVVGVKDILFNPMIALYQKKLFRPDGEVITQAYWNQWPVQDTLPYWQVKP